MRYSASTSLACSDRELADVHGRAAGFTLLELLAVFGDWIRRQGRAEQLAMATLQAQSLLARVGVDISLKNGVATGTLPKGCMWTTTATSVTARHGRAKPIRW
jgi:hypothetical protein